jgi:hypothetical protein
MRRFVDAAKVLPDHASNSDLDETTRTLVARGILEEREGKFDIYAMLKEEEEEEIISGHADYVSPGRILFLWTFFS